MVYFINADYYKKYIPTTRGVDDAQITSAIKLIQETNLVEVISEPVYNYYQEIFSNDDDMSPSETRLFNHMQTYLAVKTALQFVYVSPTRDDTVRSDSDLVYRDKAEILEGMMIRDIEADAALLTLAQSSNIEQWFSDTESYTGGFFYV